MTLASIFKQISFSEKDIYQLLGKNRGVTNIPFNNNNQI